MIAGTVPAVQLPEAKIENNLVEAAHSQRGGTVSAKVLEALHTKAASLSKHTTHAQLETRSGLQLLTARWLVAAEASPSSKTS